MPSDEDVDTGEMDTDERDAWLEKHGHETYEAPVLTIVEADE